MGGPCSYILHTDTSVHHAHNLTANPMSASVCTGNLGAHQDDPGVSSAEQTGLLWPRVHWGGGALLLLRDLKYYWL